ncbi:ABC transporter substrate-binding protein [Comamonadaceae bacterium G21597-S1]|nr:ABC transporter substrate-binding protein [Comamonadaceae bacterium G21597-S1]
MKLPSFLTTRRASIAHVLAATLLCAASAPTVLAQDKEPVKIGVLTYFGGGQIGGATIVGAAQMAVDDFGGTVNGRKIELLQGDTQRKPDVALTIAREWIEREKVSTIMTNAISPITLGLVDLVKKAKIPLLIAGPGSEDLTGTACSAFSTQFVWDAYSLPRAVINGFASQGAKTFYILTTDNAFGKSLEANVREFVTATGGKVVGVSRHPLGMQDYSSLILTAQASGADVIALGTTGEDMVNVIKQSNEFGVMQQGQKLALLTASINDIHTLGLKTAQGLRMVSPFYHDRNDETRAWSKRYMEYQKTSVPPSHLEAGVYTAVTQYLRLAKATGGTDGEKIMARFKTTPVTDFELKNVSRRDDGTMLRPMYLVSIKTPAESKAPWDYYKIEKVVPPEQAWRPAAQSKCSLLRP